jgi:hypothetical protein
MAIPKRKRRLVVASKQYRRTDKQPFPLRLSVWVSLVLLLLGLAVLVGRWVAVWNQRVWYEGDAVRIMMVEDSLEGGQVKVLSIWQGTQNSVLLTIPGSVVMGAVGGYGEYRLDTLRELGEIESLSDQLLADSISYFLGLPIHLVTEASSRGVTLRSTLIPLLYQGLSGSRSLPETVAMMQLLSTYSGGDANEVLLSEQNALRTRFEADGSSVVYADPALLQRLLMQKKKTLSEEAALVQVAVVNMSGKSSMAALWSRFAQLGGFDVVSVTDQPVEAETTTLLFADVALMRSRIGKQLIALYPLATVEVGEVSRYRADIALLVGLDSWRWVADRSFYLDRVGN